MTTAAVDVLGFLPGPVSKNNAGAADLLAGELFAYAVSSGVAVVDVHRMQLTCVLHGGHKSASTTAVSWYSLELAVSQPVWVSSAGRQSAFQETQLHLS
ncbi:hypothetical protein MMC14_009772 [Varicellaria rhodocarpa]|nr:hypothetical protein [Varicellaria rhodocarpa]